MHFTEICLGSGSCLALNIICGGGGGGVKNAYELINLRPLKFSTLY